MIVEMMLLSTAATVTTNPRVRFPGETGVTPCELTLEDRSPPVSVSAVKFVEVSPPADVITAADLWDTPLTIDQAVSFGKTLMRNGTSDFVEID